MRKGRIRCFLAGLLISLAFGAVGGNDYQDEKAEQEQYCNNVKAKIWYDSEENIQRKCKPGVDSR